jgi:hypothetical protein
MLFLFTQIVRSIEMALGKVNQARISTIPLACVHTNQTDLDHPAGKIDFGVSLTKVLRVVVQFCIFKQGAPWRSQLAVARSPLNIAACSLRI